jgi:hypothetical protein
MVAAVAAVAAADTAAVVAADEAAGKAGIEPSLASGRRLGEHAGLRAVPPDTLPYFFDAFARIRSEQLICVRYDVRA